MNRAESQYTRTAARMDEAFWALLDQKEFAYITVKEICEKAGVNRSTFYLHYESIADLLSESLAYMNERFLSYFTQESRSIAERLRTCPLSQLRLVTPEYLTPYLRYIQANKRPFQAAIRNFAVMRLGDVYRQLFRDVFTPILERYDVPERNREYVMAFYIRGMMAIIAKWLERDCADPIEQIISVIEQCVPGRMEDE